MNSLTVNTSTLNLSTPTTPKSLVRNICKNYNVVKKDLSFYTPIFKSTREVDPSYAPKKRYNDEEYISYTYDSTIGKKLEF